MTHGSLFSGIGGFDLAAEWMGWQNVFHCEWNEFGKRVLKHYWPNAISYDDITKADFTIHRGRIDILTGGFPCQPYSAAGKRLGKEDERHLWPEMLRAIREIWPRWVVGENVRGLVNWSGGLVFDEVQADLEAIGYEVTAYILPACAKDAPHRRDRVWFVAYCDDKERDGRGCSSKREWKEAEQGRDGVLSAASRFSQERPTPNADSLGQHDGSDNRQERPICDYEQRNTAQGESERNERQRGVGEICGDGDVANADNRSRPQNAVCAGRKELEMFSWQEFPTVEPTIRSGDDGLPTELDGITFSKWRNESIKAYGNAVVPQVVFEIFKAIQTHEHTHR